MVPDSTAGKLMEKVGGLLHKDGLVEKGREMRVSKGFGEEEDEEEDPGRKYPLDRPGN
jgi:hypothetical protein